MTISGSGAHARKDVISSLLFLEKSGNTNSVGLESRHSFVGYNEIAIPQWVVIYNQRKICLGVRQLILTDFLTGLSWALSPRHALP